MLQLVSRLNIGPRLILGFLIIAVMCFLVGVRGLAANATANEQLKNANNNTIPSLIHLDNVRSGVLAIQRSERILILALLRHDDKRCQQTYTKFDQGWSELNTGIAEYVKLPMSSAEKELFQNFQTALAAWKRDHDTIVRFAKAKDTPAAEDAMMREWASSAGRLNETLTEMMNLQQSIAREEQTRSEQRAQSLRLEMWSAIAVATLGAIGLGLLLSTSVIRPLKETVRVLEAVAQGDLSTTATVRSKDEVGRMAASLNVAIGALIAAQQAEHDRVESERVRAEKEAAAERERAEKEAAAERELAQKEAAAAASLRERIDTIASTVGAMAEGDFTQQVPDLGTDAVGQLAESLNKTLVAVRTALEGVREVSEQLADASGQLASASDEISLGAQEQASSLEETASTLHEITSTVRQSSDNAQQARQLASSSKEVAEKGGAVVGSAVDAMSEINASSKKIAEIITAIDEIAFQTNLLALNAAVEAARAGEQGRGFAVVAAEVRNLAQRSATAAKEIKGLIQDSVKKVDAGTELVNKSGTTLSEIVTSVKRVTDIVTEIAAASREQSTGIDQVNKAVSQMDTVTQRNASQTEELSATAQTLTDQAVQLRDLIARFKLSGEAPARAMARPAPQKSAKRSAPKSRSAVVRATANGRGHAHELDSLGGSDDGFTEF